MPRPHLLRSLLGLLAAALAGLSAHAQLTTFYFVRHSEVDQHDPHFGLSTAGRARAAVLATTLRDIPFTLVFSSHTTRSLQEVAPIAERLRLTVTQLPKPGSILKGKPVTDLTPSPAAIAPLVAALRAVPDGSTVLVGVNSSNAFPVMTALGAPLQGEHFPEASFDDIWILTLEGPERRPHFTHLHYGTP